MEDVGHCGSNPGAHTLRQHVVGPGHERAQLEPGTDVGPISPRLGANPAGMEGARLGAERHQLGRDRPLHFWNRHLADPQPATAQGRRRRVNLACHRRLHAFDNRSRKDANPQAPRRGAPGLAPGIPAR